MSSAIYGVRQLSFSCEESNVTEFRSLIEILCRYDEMKFFITSVMPIKVPELLTCGAGIQSCVIPYIKEGVCTLQKMFKY